MFLKKWCKSTEECFICCSVDGKTEKEKIDEIIYFDIKMNYPLISLSNAYGCKCKNLYAHNKCLININKCPTCRKVSLPNLYVITGYDYYLSYLLTWVKYDTSRIKKLNIYLICYLIFICILLLVLDENKKTVITIIPPKSNLSLCFSIIIGSSFGFSLYILGVFNDYLKKYWLYNENTKKYDIFNNKSVQKENNSLLVIQLRTIINRQLNIINNQRDRIIHLEHQIA